MIRTLSIVFLLGISPLSSAQHPDTGNQLTGADNSTVQWIQHTLDNWRDVCLNELKIEAKTLPWIIFYDSTTAWHLNADESKIPPFEKTNNSVAFGGVGYSLIKVTHAANLWVPERDAIPVSALLTTTIPYAQNKKTFFIAPLPSLFHKLAPKDQWHYLDFLFLGITIHELTHTRQLPFVLPQLLELDKKDKRESLNDNTVEEVFSKDERYKTLYFEENARLWKAVFMTNDDSCRAEIRQVLKMTDMRRREFFTGDNATLAQADEIFLSLEGSAMWAQYRVMMRNAPNPNQRDMLSWLVQQSPAWSQERGLVLFLLIDRFSSDWKKHFFEKELPPAATYLKKVLNQRK